LKLDHLNSFSHLNKIKILLSSYCFYWKHIFPVWTCKTKGKNTYLHQ